MDFSFFALLQDDIRRVKRDLEKSGGEQDDLTSKIEELNLYNDSSEKELRTIISSKQVGLSEILKSFILLTNQKSTHLYYTIGR